jgi:hypothetical protein
MELLSKRLVRLQKKKGKFDSVPLKDPHFRKIPVKSSSVIAFCHENWFSLGI